MLAIAPRPIGPDETSDEVERDLAELGAAPARSTSLDATRGGPRVETPQDDALATYAAKITKDEGADRLVAAGRADSQPGPRPAAVAARRRAGIGGARVLIRSDRADAGRQPGSPPGTIVRADAATRFEVVAGDGRVLRVLEHPARRAAADDRARVPRRHGASRRATRFDAADDRAGARLRRTRRSARSAAGRADLPHALARARDPAARRARSRAGRRDRHRHAALAGRARSPHRGVRRPAASRSSTPKSSTSCAAAVFQLLHLDRVPASAVVNDAVDLTRKARQEERAGRSSTRVLRRVSRERARLPLPPRPPDPAIARRRSTYLAITLSHPRWLVGALARSLRLRGDGALGQFNNAPAPLTLRANRCARRARRCADRSRRHGVETEPGRFAPTAWSCERAIPLLTPLADSGLFVVQDEASQLVACARRRARRRACARRLRVAGRQDDGDGGGDGRHAA